MKKKASFLRLFDEEIGGGDEEKGEGKALSFKRSENVFYDLFCLNKKSKKDARRATKTEATKNVATK